MPTGMTICPGALEAGRQQLWFAAENVVPLDNDALCTEREVWLFCGSQEVIDRW